MAYQIEDVNSCTKKINFNFAKTLLSERIVAGLKEKQKTANLKGFRQGKVPAEVVQRYYGPQVKADAINHLLWENYVKAIQETKLHVVSDPQIADIDLGDKDANATEIKFSATVEVFPKFDLVDISSWEFKKDAVQVADKEVEQAVHQIQEKYAVMENAPEGSALANGQFAIIDFEGIHPNGTRPANMKGQGFSLEIGSHSFVDTFEEQLIGMKVGEERTIEVTFPADYGAKDLQNQKVKFEVKLQEIKNKVFPEIDAEFLKEEGHKTKEEFLAAVRLDIENGKKKAVEQKLRREVLNRLVKENQFLVPQAMINSQLGQDQKHIREQYKAYRMSDGQIEEYLQKNAEMMRQNAEHEIREALIVNRYAEDAKIEIGDADVEEHLAQAAKTEKVDIAQYQEMLKKHPEYKTNIKMMLREQKAIAEILKKVKIS